RRLISIRRSPQPRIPRRGQTSSRKARARLSLRIFFFRSLPVDSIVAKMISQFSSTVLVAAVFPTKKESRIQKKDVPSEFWILNSGFLSIVNRHSSFVMLVRWHPRRRRSLPTCRPPPPVAPPKAVCLPADPDPARGPS